ncbi:MAG: T9SS type A sorting domain-containing protein [Ignavibacteriaceae bacterium]|nr:T9SS type A sorting domain-containing protein [Ignavibacteriaceae bacterium]
MKLKNKHEGFAVKKLLSFFSLLTTFIFLSLPLLAQETTTNAAKTSKTILITFSVDMELERLAGFFHPGSDTVSVGGNFNAWEKTNMTVSQSNPDIYTATISVTDSVQDTIRFNFCYSPDIWEVVGVREYVITQANYDSGFVRLGWIGFDSEPFSSPTRVEFRCNMTIEMRNREFVRGEKVFVRGDFNGWSGNDFELKDVDGDSIYSRIFYNFKADQKLTFKFTNNHNGNDVWEATGNRRLTVSSTGPNIFTGIWEDACFCTHYKTIQVTFSVNMEFERLFGYFNPLTDTLSVRGSFNGWGKTVMTELPDSADIYRVTTPAVVSVDEKINFLFFYSPGTWERDNLDGNFERFFIVTQEVFNSGSFAYDAIGFNIASPDPPYFLQDPLIVFKCNTNGGKIINAPDGTEFKTIHIAGSNYPMRWPGGGWPNSDMNKVMQLFDDGTHNDAIAGDKIFTNIIQFPKYYTSSHITYRYGANWGLETNGGGNNNEFISESYHTLNLLFSKFDYDVADTFGVERHHDFTDVEKIENAIPSTFKLEQNYPNPFNPNTVISYQLSVDSKVSLRVFDILGNEVAMLVNEEQPAGTYQVSFNQQQLASGIYFYQLRAGNFVQTKKMVLLR